MGRYNNASFLIQHHWMVGTYCRLLSETDTVTPHRRETAAGFAYAWWRLFGVHSFCQNQFRPGDQKDNCEHSLNDNMIKTTAAVVRSEGTTDNHR